MNPIAEGRATSASGGDWPESYAFIRSACLNSRFLASCLSASETITQIIVTTAIMPTATAADTSPPREAASCANNPIEHLPQLIGGCHHAREPAKAATT